MKNSIKSMTMLLALIAAGTTVSFAQEKGKEKEENHHVGEVGKGPHGGTVQEADPNHAEILVKDGMVMLYLLDGDAKMMSNSGVTAKATFLMPDGKSVNETLTASGDDGFMVNNKDVVKYKSCIASFTIKGKTVSAKFKNYSTASTKSMSYVCPMHPEVTSDKPGKCPKCGMDLVEAKSKTEDHHHH
ncbi:MAG TPA: heavy metal-binding domain-containing protein [Bacteroidia bacterium]|nr:heavy metal-binding domain-containing protein [Bacteroidia bacterium]